MLLEVKCPMRYVYIYIYIAYMHTYMYDILSIYMYVYVYVHSFKFSLIGSFLGAETLGFGASTSFAEALGGRRGQVSHGVRVVSLPSPQVWGCPDPRS